MLVQYRRHADMLREAEFRRFVDILSHEIGTALTAITGQAYRLTKLSTQLTPGDLMMRVDKSATQPSGSKQLSTESRSHRRWEMRPFQ